MQDETYTFESHNQVLVLFLLDTANTGFDIAFMYEPLINHFGKHSPSFDNYVSC